MAEAITIGVHIKLAKGKMERFLVSLCFLGSVLHTVPECTGPASEFQLAGDYLIGGVFEIHHVTSPVYHERPEAVSCSR